MEHISINTIFKFKKSNFTILLYRAKKPPKTPKYIFFNNFTNKKTYINRNDFFADSNLKEQNIVLYQLPLLLS